MQQLPPYAIVGLVVLTGVALFLAGTQGTRLLRPTAPTPGKLTTYECGVDPVGDGWAQSNIRYYLYAYLYVVFAVDAMYLLPWATVLTLPGFGWRTLVEMGVFLGRAGRGAGPRLAARPAALGLRDRVEPMAGVLIEVASVLAGVLVTEHGFTRKGRHFLREDELLRSVVVTPSKTAAPGAYEFEVLLNLGLRGLSSSTSARREWVVMATVGKIERLRDRSAVRFELTGNDAADSQVTARVVELVRVLAGEFLLRPVGQSDLIELVVDGADEFKRLDLSPWNVLPRLGLACVYLDFVGESERADDVQDRALRLADEQGVHYFAERLREDRATALLRRGSAIGSGA